MEFADNGDLQARMDEIKRSGAYMSEDSIWSMAVKLLSALHCLHSLKIVHRDIKCANVFLCKDGSLKLGDLNVSKVAKYGMLQT